METNYLNSLHLEKFMHIQSHIGIKEDEHWTPVSYTQPHLICTIADSIRNTVFNFNKLVSDLDIHANTPES